MCELASFVDSLPCPWVDDLKVGRDVEPMCDRDVVIHLDRVLVLQAEIEPLTQKRHEIATELGASEANAEAIVGVARHHTFAAYPGDEGVFDGIWVSIGGTKPEEQTHAVLWVVVRLPEILIEGIRKSQAAARAIDGSPRH